MKLRIFTEPQQGASHADLLAVARATRDGGFSAFFRSLVSSSASRERCSTACRWAKDKARV